MKNGQENESHLSLQLASERKATDSTSKSLTKCEELLKKITTKNELLGRENTSLADNVRNEIHLLSLNERFTCFVRNFIGCRSERAFKRVTKT